MSFIALCTRRAWVVGLALVLCAGQLLVSGGRAHAASVPWICANDQVCAYDPSGKRMFVLAAPLPGQCTTIQSAAFGPVTTVVNTSDRLVKMSAEGCSQAAANPQVTAPARQTVMTSYWLRIGTRISAVA